MQLQFTSTSMTKMVSSAVLFYLLMAVVSGAKETCPISGQNRKSAAQYGTTNRHWWPQAPNLKILHQHSAASNPMGKSFAYKKEFLKLNLNEVKKDLLTVMQDSKAWWPADYGHYGPFLIRMAWHSAGTYRIGDGRGGGGTGNQRLAPLNSWPDNANLDKARMLIWPVKQKYGSKISWGDLMVLAGNVALESMGLKTVGFAGGRVDVWEPEEDIYWGSEDTWLGDNRYSGDRQLENPLAAVQMGLIYVNPEGPNGKPDPVASARDIRETFRRMGMNDEETVALVAGGHTLGKCHGAGKSSFVGPEPEGAPVEQQSFGWLNRFGKGYAEDTITSGYEGAWKPNPIQFDNMYFVVLFRNQWKLTRNPSGNLQWTPKNPPPEHYVQDAHIPGKRNKPMMLTADMAIREDPIYAAIGRKYLNDSDSFAEAFSRAWFKLTHRDMGPRSRYLGDFVPVEEFIWQDPIPASTRSKVSESDIKFLTTCIENSGLTVPELVGTAWASASTFRGSDKRGGANGARVRLEPQASWAVNNPTRLFKVLDTFAAIQNLFNNMKPALKKHISLADLIVLGGNVGVSKAAKAAGFDVIVPFSPGRGDATQVQTDPESFEALRPLADGFRNYQCKNFSVSPEELLVDRAQLLTLTAPEMTVLVGGLRALNANWDGSDLGILTNRPGMLTNDFFVNLLDIGNEWKQVSDFGVQMFLATSRKTGAVTWKASRVDLIFGHNSQLRAISEVYASSDAEHKFVSDFVKAWAKVMDLDRFDVR